MYIYLEYVNNHKYIFLFGQYSAIVCLVKFNSKHIGKYQQNINMYIFYIFHFYNLAKIISF